MPWTETCPLDQRLAFIAEWLRDEWTMTEAGGSAIKSSRKTAYKWVDRYNADPADGAGGPLAGTEGARTGDGRSPIRDAILALRGRHPQWEPKKLRAILAEQLLPDDTWPAASTIGELLRRRRRQSAAASPAVCRAVDAAVGGGAGAE